MSIYASTLVCSEEDTDTVDASIISKNVSSRGNLAIASDFNTKTRTAAVESNSYRKQIGIY